MKRFALSALMLLAACDKPAAPPAPSPARPQATAPAAPAAPAAPSAPASAPAAAPVVIADKSALINFSYQWPAEAAAIPALDARLRADARTSRQHAINGAREDKRARPADAPFFAHEMQKTWTVEGEAAGLLALRDEFATFTGGAHGMSGFEAILWDRAAGRDITPWSLFTDRARALAALKARFCPALNAERAARRGAPVTTGEDWDVACPDITKQIVIPSDVKNGRFTSLRVLIGPYEAGPYAEGSYDVNLPVDAAILALLRPERRGAFAARP
ncbi:PdaC/SigV domain-containing protein [Sphingomonas quercus]|nr:DUF4163 domain-containing protein [Sphingomonas quercus]